MASRRRFISLCVCALALSSCRRGEGAETKPVASVTSVASSNVPSEDDAVVERLRMMGMDPRAVGAFLDDLKRRVAGPDRSSACALASYPFPVRSTTSTRNVKSVAECRSRPDRIFTPRVVAAIAEQRFGALFVNSDGIMIGDGAVWFAGICDDDSCQRVQIRIRAIND